MKKSLIAAASVATLALAPSAASAQAMCAVGVIVAAIHVGAQENRELTEKEAFTCGLSYVVDKHEKAGAGEKPAIAKKQAKKKTAQDKGR